MKHAPTIEITCDGPSCYESMHAEMDYVYRDYSGSNGYWSEDNLDMGDWIEVGNDGDSVHFCCEDCKDEFIAIETAGPAGGGG